MNASLSQSARMPYHAARQTHPASSLMIAIMSALEQRARQAAKKPGKAQQATSLLESRLSCLAVNAQHERQTFAWLNIDTHHARRICMPCH